jgi:hypothetical protein
MTTNINSSSNLISAVKFTGITFAMLGYETLLRSKHGIFALQEAVNTIALLALSNLNGYMNLATSITTGGTKSLRRATAQLDGGFGTALGKTFLNLLRVINPKAQCLKKAEFGAREEFAAAPGFLESKKIPLYLFSVSRMQQRMIDSLNRSSWMINRQLIARIAAPIGSAIAMVSGLGIFAFGVLNVALSVITLGTHPTFNTRAYHAFKVPSFMQNQLRQGLLGIFRPELLSSEEKAAHVEDPQVAEHPCNE